MTVCLDHDVNSEDDGDRSKTGILSNSNDELLRECWKTWRLSDPFRAVLYMDLLKGYIDKGALDLDYAKDAMRSLDKCLKENEVANWTINDVSLLFYFILFYPHCILNYFSVKIWYACMKG
jgi:hypothetical protein